MLLQCKGFDFYGALYFFDSNEIVKSFENRLSGSETESECQLPS